MRYYIRAKEFIKNLFSRLLRGTSWGKDRLGDWREKIRLDGLRDKVRLDGLRDKVRSFNVDGLRQGVSRFGRNFDRQKLAQYKSFESLKNFDYERFFDKIFSPQSYRTIHWSFLIIILVVLTYSMGKMAAYMAVPSGKISSQKKTAKFGQQIFANDHREEWDQIVAADLFRTEVETVSPEKPKEREKEKSKVDLVCEDSDKKSSLPFRLVNTIVLQNRKKSLAAVEQKNKKKVLYLREGDRVEGILVKKISDFKMVFANHGTGKCEYIAGKGNKQEERFWNAKKPKIVSAEEGRKLLNAQKNEKVVKVGNTYQIKKEVKNEILDNINTVLTQARAIEIKNPDGSLCFKMVDIVPGSPYSMLDIQNNDTICSINGKKIENLNSLFALFGKMRDIQHFEMVVKRDGQEIPMEYNFE